MSRHHSTSSTRHRVRMVNSNEFVLSWTVDRYFAGSRLRHPQTQTRDTDRAGAIRFIRKWKLSDFAFPEELRAEVPKETADAD